MQLEHVSTYVCFQVFFRSLLDQLSTKLTLFLYFFYLLSGFSLFNWKKFVAAFQFQTTITLNSLTDN